MNNADIDKFMGKLNNAAEKVGAYVQQKIRALPDAKLIQMAREGNVAAQAEADRRGLNW